VETKASRCGGDADDDLRGEVRLEMATEIRVPTLGESVSEAIVGKWFKKSGDAVNVDEPLVELETDKVTVEVPAPISGVLGDIKVTEGQTVAVGALPFKESRLKLWSWSAQLFLRPFACGRAGSVPQRVEGHGGGHADHQGGGQHGRGGVEVGAPAHGALGGRRGLGDAVKAHTHSLIIPPGALMTAERGLSISELWRFGSSVSGNAVSTARQRDSGVSASRQPRLRAGPG